MSEKSSSDSSKVEANVSQEESTCQPAILAFTLACKDKDIDKEALEAIFEKITIARAGCPYHYVIFSSRFFRSLFIFRGF